MTSSFQRWKGIMKAVPFEEKRLLKWKPPFIIQPKYDGDRCTAESLDNGSYLLLSSEENPILCLPHITAALAELRTNLKWDGELYSHALHKEGGHELIHGIVSRSVNMHPRAEEIEYHIFDIKMILPQHRRLTELTSWKHTLKPPLVMSPYWICDTLDEIMRIYDKLISMDYEGIIVRNIENFYEERRSPLIMKFKPKKEDDYEIVGFSEEISKDGIPKSSLGALICDSGDGNTFSVGTGFTADQRVDYWRVRERLVGRRCRIKYQHLTTGKKVPRFPVFSEVI